MSYYELNQNLATLFISHGFVLQLSNDIDAAIISYFDGVRYSLHGFSITLQKAGYPNYYDNLRIQGDGWQFYYPEDTNVSWEWKLVVLKVR